MRWGYQDDDVRTRGRTFVVFKATVNNQYPEEEITVPKYGEYGEYGVLLFFTC